MKRGFGRFFTGICPFFLVLILLAAPAWPQSSNGSLRGVVQDQTRAVIPNVTVVLVNEGTGIESKTTSNDAGLYVFPALTPGQYKITAEHPGMARFEVTVLVQSQTSAAVDIELKPSGTQTLVSVQDVTPMVVTDSASQIHTLEHTRIDQLPINGRSIWNLLQTVPGMTNGTDGNLHVYGLRQGTHDVLLDGAALTDYLDGGGAVTRMPSLDSIQEFTVDNNASSAKFTRPGTVIYQTKERYQPVSRVIVRNQQGQCLWRSALSQQCDQYVSAAYPQRVRRQRRRPDLDPQGLQRQEPQLLLLRL